MAVSPASLSQTRRADEMQLRMEADVRRLLRRASNPFLLAASPLAQAICETTGIVNPQSALRHAIDGAFAQGSLDSRLHRMLLTSIDNGATGANSTEGLQVSRRHLLRRRAKAVSILALHIRRLLGTARLAIDDTNAAADPLERIAELVASAEPATASRILNLSGPQTAVIASMLAMRERVNIGADLDEIAGEAGRHVALALIEVLRAQSREISGRDDLTQPSIAPIFERTGRNSDDTAEIRFELEWLAFLRASHRGEALQIDRIARNLRRLARDRATWTQRALLAQSEAKIRHGRLAEAIALLDEADRRATRNAAVTELACSSSLRAERYLQLGDDACAERLATGAYLVLRDRHFGAYQCQAIVARARLRLGKAWSCPDEFSDLLKTAWQRVALTVEFARHLHAQGYAQRAKDHAREALEVATSRQYTGLAVRAAATIGALEAQPELRRSWYMQALSQLLTTRNRSIACDLFPFEEQNGDALLAIEPDEVASLLHQGLVTAIPQLQVGSKTEGAAAREFIRRLSAWVLGHDDFSRSVDAAIAAMDRAAPSFAQYLLYFLDDASDIIETLFQAIAPRAARAEIEDKLAAAMHNVAAQIRPRSNLLHFLVG